MTSPEKHQPLEQQSPATESPEDLWVYRHRRWSSGTRWLVFSTAAHVLLLGLLATFSLTLVHRRTEPVKIFPTTDVTALLEEQQRQAAQQPPEKLEGEPSLKDLPDILKMEKLKPQEMQNPAGPPDVGELQDRRSLELTKPFLPESHRMPTIIEGGWNRRSRSIFFDSFR